MRLQIIYSSQYLVQLSILTLSYLSLYLPLRLLAHYLPRHQQKSAVLLSLYSLTWFLLLADIVLVRGPKIGGFFFITFLNAAALLATLVDMLHSLIIPRSRQSVRTRAIEHQEGESEAVETEHVTEITPLLTDNGGLPASTEKAEDNQSVSWIVEFLLLVHTHGIIISQDSITVAAALSQTLADGSAAIVGELRML